MKLLAQYSNGTYNVSLFDDGTKIRALKKGETEFIADFPENIDLKVSNKCSIGCEFCHENSCPNGKISELVYSPYDISDPLNIESSSKYLTEFLNSLKPGTELAIGGGALSEIGEHLYMFLNMCHQRSIFANITVNGKELLNDKFFANLFRYIDLKDTNCVDWSISVSLLNKELTNKITFRGLNTLIYGLGISYVNDDVIKKRMLSLKKIFPNAVVVHTIYGITTKEDYDWLAENGFKVLILGYKNFRRGEKYLEKHSKEIEKNMRDFDANMDVYYRKCKRLSFDCLATEQLKLKDKVSPILWEKSYMGNDGQFTMYVDLVENTFATNSTSTERFSCEEYNFDSSLMFKKIQNNSLLNKK